MVVSTLRVLRRLFDNLSRTLARRRRCIASSQNHALSLPVSTRIQADFPKSRVHAKLLRRLILKRYQTIKELQKVTIAEWVP
jgi:hypothetical protein